MSCDRLACWSALLLVARSGRRWRLALMSSRQSRPQSLLATTQSSLPERVCGGSCVRRGRGWTVSDTVSSDSLPRLKFWAGGVRGAGKGKSRDWNIEGGRRMMALKGPWAEGGGRRAEGGASRRRSGREIGSRWIQSTHPGPPVPSRSNHNMSTSTTDKLRGQSPRGRTGPSDWRQEAVRLPPAQGWRTCAQTRV